MRFAGEAFFVTPCGGDELSVIAADFKPELEFKLSEDETTGGGAARESETFLVLKQGLTKNHPVLTSFLAKQ